MSVGSSDSNERPHFAAINVWTIAGQGLGGRHFPATTHTHAQQVMFARQAVSGSVMLVQYEGIDTSHDYI